MKSFALLALVILQAHGFVGPHLNAIHASRAPLRMAEEVASEQEEGKVYFASEVTTEKKTKFIEDFGDSGVPQWEETVAPSDKNHGSIGDKYVGLTDGDSFDGGDGQVGCVGDGSNALDSFESQEVVKVEVKKSMVVESKQMQRNAFGSSTGYAEELKKQGMVDIDKKTGVDKLQVRRQQLENWQAQQKLKEEQKAKLARLDSITGAESGSINDRAMRGGKSYLENMNTAAAHSDESTWNVYNPETASGKKDGSEWGTIELTGRERVEAEIEVVSSSGRPGTATIEQKNTVMTFEPFKAEFVGEASGFSVSPAEGTLNRRGGDAIPIQVSFKANGPGDNRIAKLVVQTEEVLYYPVSLHDLSRT
ncbi:unnamed protein product [Chrysoparadoxa australica]